MAKKEEVKYDKKESRRRVKFSITDGLMPKTSTEPGNPFLIRMPVLTAVPAGAKRTVSLGVSCELPVVMVRQGEAKILPPSAPLTIELGGPTQTLIGEGEIVARLYVLDNGDAEVTK